MVSHGVCQCPYGIIKNEQVLVLILPKCKHQRVQDEAQVRHQLCTRLLLQSGKCTLEKMTQARTIQLYGQKAREHRGNEDMGKVRAAPAGRFLNPLIAIKDAFEQLGHEGFEMGIGRLADHPVGIAAQRPAGNRADQGLLVTQTLNKVGDELRQVRHHALHTA